MAQLVSIGSSRGVRIPKTYIEQARLEGRQLRLQVVEDGLLIAPVTKQREGWREAIEASLKAHGNEATDDEWLNAGLASDDEWEW